MTRRRWTGKPQPPVSAGRPGAIVASQDQAPYTEQMDAPVVSVLLPTFQAIATLDDALASLEAQTLAA